MIVPVQIRWIITLVFVVAVIGLSVIPGQAKTGDSVFVWLVAATPTLVQKLMHFVVYASMACLLTWSLEGVAPRWLRLTIAFTLSVGIGAALEWYQTRIPGRFGTLLDVLLNSVGVIAGLIVAVLVL